MAVARQDLQRVLHEALVVQRRARQVHADEAGVGERGRVVLDPGQRGRQHPAVDHAHAAALLGGGDQRTGRADASVLAAHAQQHLEVQRFVRRGQRHDRLHLDEHALGRVRAGQALDQVQLGLAFLEGRRVALVDHQGVAVAVLGLTAGAVGGRDRILHRHPRRDFDQADRAAHVEGLVADPVRGAADAVDDAAADQRGERDRGVRHDDHEFVAAHAPDLLAAGQRQFHALADLFQDLVAGRVAEQVVDQLEAVEVDVGHRQRLARAQRLHRALEHLLDAAPVEDLGQRVVVGHEAQLLGGLVFFGDVLQHRLDAAACQRCADHEAVAAVAARDLHLGFALHVHLFV